jgi:hypothetical protein
MLQARQDLGEWAAAAAVPLSGPALSFLAQNWLGANQPGTTATSPDPPTAYYTVDFQMHGKLVGMLSVNGSSGAIWFHSWPGSFVQERELGA